MKDNEKSTEWVKNVADLARIELSPAQEKKYVKQLSAVLENFEFLRELDISDVEPTAQVIGLENIYRNDEVKNPSGKKVRDELLSNAPEIENGSVKVPEVFSNE